MAGVIGTAIMTIVAMLAPMMGIPEMSPPKMLSGILGIPISIGWIMHFITGIIFALAYTYLASPALRINNLYFKGMAFGMLVFVLAQFMMALMARVMNVHPMGDSMILSTIGSLIGHIIFGITVAKIVGNNFCANRNLETK